jgi:hypothetical protein
MKNFLILSLILLSLTSCSVNNFYLCTLDGPVEVYSSPSLDTKIGTIYSSQKLVAESNRKSYRKVRFGEYSGYICNKKFQSEVKVSKYQLPYLVRVTDSTRQTKISPSYIPSSGTVSVKGYYRKDGTYVRPHTRSAPKRH